MWSPAPSCDPGKDLVVLALEKDWPGDPLRLSGDKPRLGEDVFAIGAPQGLTETITRGIVSQLRSAADISHRGLSPSTKIIQTDAFFTHGSSGGPLCSADGKVIGITSFGVQQDPQSAEFQFAIAAEELADLLSKANSVARPLTELPPARD
jgi:S1-C subfamily serine protease